MKALHEDSSKLPFKYLVGSLTQKYFPFTLERVEELHPGFISEVEGIHTSVETGRQVHSIAKEFAKGLAKGSLPVGLTVAGSALINSNHEIVASWTEHDKRIFIEALCNREVESLRRVAQINSKVFGETYLPDSPPEVARAVWTTLYARFEDRKMFSSILMKRTLPGHSPERG